MSATPAFAARPLDAHDWPEAAELAASVGVHGVYLGNFLSGRCTAGDGGEIVGFYGSDALLGIAYFGDRGNLVLVEREPLDAGEVATAVARSGHAWRIALGPSAAIRELAAREATPPLVVRRQVYYGCEPDAAAAALVREDVRPAERRDMSALVKAALELNASDLGVDPRRVHRPWLKEAIRRRIRRGQTLVLGGVGDLACKLDLGSCGPRGMVVEGVYTPPEHRGKGLAAALVATVVRSAIGRYPLACLHVGADNAPARRAYERAGMRELADCELLLRA